MEQTNIPNKEKNTIGCLSHIALTKTEIAMSIGMNKNPKANRCIFFLVDFFIFDSLISLVKHMGFTRIFLPTNSGNDIITLRYGHTTF